MRGEAVDTIPEKGYLIIAELFFNIIFGAVAGLMFTSISSLRVRLYTKNDRFPAENDDFLLKMTISR